MGDKKRIALLVTRVRTDEKLLIAALQKRNIPFDLLYDGDIVFDLAHPESSWYAYSAVLCRSMSQSRGLAAASILEQWGIPVYNPFSVMTTCNDKLLTTLALLNSGIPTPRTLVAFQKEPALRAIERVRYPAVLKPIVGSWGRLLSRVNDQDAAEAVLEHKETLGSYQHHIHYIQEHIDKPQRDIRAFVVGERTIGAKYRVSEHWVTSSNRGAKAVSCEIDQTLDHLCVQASRAVGGGILAIDILEDPERGYLVNEINATMEFRESIISTGADIPNEILNYILDDWKEKGEQ
jgi:[lysine-biosynthesis-protein LysW]--L-2-aminoadipate ligase